jgi:hypothetical protein
MTSHKIRRVAPRPEPADSVRSDCFQLPVRDQLSLICRNALRMSWLSKICHAAKYCSLFEVRLALLAQKGLLQPSAPDEGSFGVEAYHNDRCAALIFCLTITPRCLPL